MKNVVAEYLKKSVNPGGTPRRMKEWMGFMLLLQMCAAVLPTAEITKMSVVDILVISTTVLLVSGTWANIREKHQILLCKGIFAGGMVMQLIGTVGYHSGSADFVMGCSWGLAMFINERRGYITFSEFLYSTLLMILVLSASTIINVYDSVKGANTIALVSVGVVTIVSNIYLLLVDFKHGKHRIDYFERHFDKIDQLSANLSGILMADKPFEQVLWDVTQECIPLLDVDDFIIYLYNSDKNKLVQVAAYGHKLNNEQQVLNPIEIQPGRGVVGRVFQTKKAILLNDTTQEKEYIVDEQRRMSELAVPILIGDKVFGVIDSEHPQRGFYKEQHLQLFNVIAAFCSVKAAQEELRVQKLEAEKNRLEVMKMKELEQLKTKFITNISHDLKTPMSLILGPANQIHKTAKDDFIRLQAMYIMKNTDHLMSMVEQLLQLNRIDTGLETIKEETVELNRVFDDMKIQYSSLAEQENIDFDVQVEGAVLITTDGFKLSQCIHNLLQNAFKYTPASGRVSLHASLIAANKVRIVVKDTGIGIAKEEQDKVFERFYKINVNNHKGTGIGLSLVREYLSQLKGSISIDSAPGKGTSFTILLPLVLDAAKTKSGGEVSIEIPADDKLPLVLVAEDHVELNEFITHSLQNEGYRCLQAYNGREALMLTQQYLPDLVISDLMMPELSGEEFVAQIKEADNTGHIPVIILSAKNQVDNRVDLYSIGADNYIPKPFRIEELLAVVDNTLKQRRKLRDVFYMNFMPAGTEVSVPLESNNTSEMDSDNTIVQSCMSYVLAHLDSSELNVNTLGIAVNMGRNRLQKEIKTATGLTPVEFIRSIRLHEANKLLQSNKQHNISEVAYMTGFSNLSYFSRSFKAQFGYAPSELVG